MFLFYIFFILISIVDGTNLYTYIGVRLGLDRMIVGFITVCNQRLYITAKVVSLNPSHDEVYSVQHYVIKFLSDLRQVSGFLWVQQFPSLIKKKGPPRNNWIIVESGVKHHNSYRFTYNHCRLINTETVHIYLYIQHSNTQNMYKYL